VKYIISILFFSLLVSFNQGVLAKENPQAMIVFDASGSMWGQVDGKAKITIAKQALNKVVTNWDDNIYLGLMAYGHRRKGDCSDIQTLVPIGQVNKQNIISKVKEIKPKGKTPISRSIKKAADALRYTEEKATIILISDGQETCNADPCVTAKSLENEGIDFIAHVIGFDVDKKTDAQLKCIADVTGGEYFSAKNAKSLNNAMAQIVKKVQKAEPKPKPPVVKKLKKNLEITASESERSKWIKASHYIYPVVDGEKQDHMMKGCTSYKKKACIEQIPVGKYIIESSYNEFKQETAFEIKSGELTKVHVVMGQTGKVEISASESEGSKWIKASHYIYPVVDGEKQDHMMKGCTSYKKKACVETIPVGKYEVISSYKDFKRVTPLDVKANNVTKLQVIFSQFLIDAKCADMNSEITYEVYAGNGQMIFDKKAKCSDKVNLSLLQGNYSLEATVNNKTKEVKFGIGANKPNKLTVDMLESKAPEESHEVLIKADSPKQKQLSPPVSEPQVAPHSDDSKAQKDLEEKSAKETKELSKEPSKELSKTTVNINLAALKESIVVSLPILKQAKDCYQKAEDLSQANECDLIKQNAMKKAQQAIHKITGRTLTETPLEKQPEWNHDIKTKVLNDIEKDIKKMQLSTACFEKGLRMECVVF